ncbi:hypothetical protein GDO86_010789 [Hymenochirus boettgeri]|uniref:SHSP domain-containing protein n=1 Tax=Hymenochirus boettgeri TaxID=247094 RepID=A0A8T2JDY0_9PIPI|nr:hypothetical protein GDO86_010789 [Hymenochirus boettgeri]
MDSHSDLSHSDIFQEVRDGINMLEEQMREVFGLGAHFQTTVIATETTTWRILKKSEERSTQKEIAIDTSETTGKQFMAIVPVEGYYPDEVTVRVRDGKVSIKGNHEEGCSDHHGNTTSKNMSFFTEITLPNDAIDETVEFTFNDENKLVIKASRCGD